MSSRLDFTNSERLFEEAKELCPGGVLGIRKPGNFIPGEYPVFLKKRILSTRGHMCNEDAAKIVTYAAQMGCKKFVLSHLSRDNNTPEAAYDAAFQGLQACNKLPNRDIEILVARPDNVTKPVIL